MEAINEQRAGRALRALKAYMNISGMEHELEGAIADLSADLLHLAKAEGYAPKAVAARAWGHYVAETLKEE